MTKSLLQIFAHFHLQVWACNRPIGGNEWNHEETVFLSSLKCMGLWWYGPTTIFSLRTTILKVICMVYIMHWNPCSHFVVCCYLPNIPISFRVTSLALGQSYDCPSASEVTLQDMGKLITGIYTELLTKPGPHFIIKMVFPGMGISIVLKIILLWDHPVFILGIHILVRQYLYIDMGPGCHFNIKMMSYLYRKSYCGDKMIL